MTARITLEEAIKRVNGFYNNTIEIIEYFGIKKSTITRCLICETIWESPSRKIVNGNGRCPKCSYKKRKSGEKFSIEKAISSLEERNCKFVGKTPKSCNDIVEIEYCDCGHINLLCFSDFKKKFGCKKCKEDTFYTNRYKEEDLIKITKDNNLLFIGFESEYKDGSSIFSYSCELGHITNRMVKSFIKFPTCKKCKIIRRNWLKSGERSPSWKGGISKIWVAARNRLDPWNLKSLKEAGYKCCITGEENIRLDVHHITSFNIIVKEVMEEFGIYDENYYLKTYNECGEELLSRIVALNNEYGLGACMKTDIHILYHSIYGHGNNTPAQFAEFKQRIQSGEIQLPG